MDNVVCDMVGCWGHGWERGRLEEPASHSAVVSNHVMVRVYACVCVCVCVCLRVCVCVHFLIMHVVLLCSTAVSWVGVCMWWRILGGKVLCRIPSIAR
jgi:hypothetical protein